MSSEKLKKEKPEQPQSATVTNGREPLQAGSDAKSDVEEPAQPQSADGESVQESVPGRPKGIRALVVGSTPDVNKRRSIVFQNVDMPTAALCKQFDFHNVPVPWHEDTTWVKGYDGERRATIDSIVSRHRAEFRKSSS